jgi:hypothetical protein
LETETVKCASEKQGEIMRVKVFADIWPANLGKLLDNWAKEEERDIVKVIQVCYSSKSCEYITTTIFYKEVR